MPRRLARKLMLSITVIVIIVAAVSGLVNVSTEEQQLLNTMIVGADQLSKGITSATWHAMLDDHRAETGDRPHTHFQSRGASDVLHQSGGPAERHGGAAGKQPFRPALTGAHFPRDEWRPPHPQLHR